MKPWLLNCLIYLIPLSVCGQQMSIKRIDDTRIFADSLTQSLQHLMQAAHVTGLQITVFNHDTAVYIKSFGYRDAKSKAPLQYNTEIYAASLSKVIFAVITMKLVEQGILDLDKPLQEYIDTPVYKLDNKEAFLTFHDLKKDDRYKLITARMCLSHTTGFPNWRQRERRQRLTIKSAPGTLYSYSGEGLSYLQLFVERMTNRKLEDLAQEYVFKPLKMDQTSFIWQTSFDQNFAEGHDKKGAVLPKLTYTTPVAAGSMETTQLDYSTFLAAILQGRLLKPETWKAMFSPQIRIKSATQFQATSVTDKYDGIALSYGLGCGLFNTPAGFAIFKEGHGQGFQHYFVLFPQKQTGILIMTNSDNGESIFKEILETAIGDKYTPWEWENYIPYNL